VASLSSAPNDQILFDAQYQTSSEARRQGLFAQDLQGETGGNRRRRDFGAAVLLRPASELDLLRRSGKPSRWNPVQRPATTHGRDDSLPAIRTPARQMGLQMTPHDEWDYDGVTRLSGRH